MNRNDTILNPIEWNEAEPIKCDYCSDNLTPDEILEQDGEDEKFCNDCSEEFIFSCCGDKLDQDIRICPTCKEHN
tara:strand:+ start:473 stop:697 length:225 start_codon:yes stop_codon:yes gene_type:complete